VRPAHSQHSLVDEKIFAFATEYVIGISTRLRCPISLLTVFPQGGAQGESAAPADLPEQLTKALCHILRATDLICFSPDDRALRILLVDAPLEALPGIIQRISAEVEAQRFSGGWADRTVTLSVGGACFPTTAGTAEELVNRADTLAAEARRDPLTGSRYRLR
jgi:Diguanylate cyclase, GGDEF domain